MVAQSNAAGCHNMLKMLKTRRSPVAPEVQNWPPLPRQVEQGCCSIKAHGRVRGGSENQKNLLKLLHKAAHIAIGFSINAISACYYASCLVGQVEAKYIIRSRMFSSLQWMLLLPPCGHGLWLLYFEESIRWLFWEPLQKSGDGVGGGKEYSLTHRRSSQHPDLYPQLWLIPALLFQISTHFPSNNS